jgi:hypothetical protein
MALKITAVQGPNGAYANLGDLNGRLYLITGDTSYPNGGTEPTSGYTVKGNIALGTILYGHANPASNNAMGVECKFRPDTGRVHFFYPTGGTTGNANVGGSPLVTPGSATNNSNNSTLGGNNATLTGGPGIEIPNGANCVSLSYQVLFIGY